MATWSLTEVVASARSEFQGLRQTDIGVERTVAQLVSVVVFGLVNKLDVATDAVVGPLLWVL